MKEALLFRENEDPILVTAEQVKNGLYSRYEEFVDPDYEFKVQFVKGSKNNGGPYFRLYYSYEEYKKLYPERATRYEIVANMRRFEESEWHRSWKDKVADFCSIERCIKNELTNKRKFADAFYEKTKTCIEFQYSYISFNFEERNEFYSDLGINTIWLYALPNANARENDDGNIEILEDNARGFFRISENPENLKNHCVYIQVKSGMIYRVTELFRRDSSIDQKSTIRYFIPTEVYTENEFIDKIKANTIGNSFVDNSSIAVKEKTINENSSNESKIIPKYLDEIWDKRFSWMRVRNVEEDYEIYINRDASGEMFRDYKTDCIKYTYANSKYGYQPPKIKKEYHLSHEKENKAIWVLVKAIYKYL